MQRRTFIRTSATVLSALPFINSPLNPLHDTLLTEELNVFKFKMGQINCTLFRDFLFKYLAKDFFTNANEPELNQLLLKYKATPDNIPSPFIALLLEYDNKKVLIDTGAGHSEKEVIINGRPIPFKGVLQELLLKQGIKKDEITHVILTHFHPDHIGGIFDDTAKLIYPNAQFITHADEWDYWSTEQALSRSAVFRYFIEKNVQGLKDHNFRLITGDFVEVLPGVTAIKADGHTPGHIGLAIQSEKKGLLYISDTVLHPGHIEHLDWQTSYDSDHDKAKQSRIKMLELAYKEDMLVNAFHFDFPGLGRIDKHENNWAWKYTEK
jgi:glyoxylase-like metal-dependent hydrolase (beta-lactamase superfamily II)